ncbi:MAG: hypothetical protein SGILL_002936 [Bacillariaceae sp.]
MSVLPKRPPPPSRYGFARSIGFTSKDVHYFLIAHYPLPILSFPFFLPQCGLDRLSGKLARRDNFYYLGNACRVGRVVRMGNGVKSLQLFQLIWELQHQSSGGDDGIDDNQQQTTSASLLLNETKDLLQEHLRQHHNIILSSEHFTSQVLHWHDDADNTGYTEQRFFQHLKLLLVGFDVRIVIGYRHYFEWLPSVYYQHYHDDERYLQWEDDDRGSIVHHPSFREFARHHVDAWEANRGEDTSTTDDVDKAKDGTGDLIYATHPTIQALRLWSKHFDYITLLNLHGNENIELNTKTAAVLSPPLTQFVCDMMPSAYETCRALQEKGSDYFVPSSRMRVSSDFYAERLVEEAYQRGVIVGGGGGARNHGTAQQQNKTKRVIKALPVHLVKYMLRHLGVYEDEQYWICEGTAGDILMDRLKDMSMFWMEQVMWDEKWNYNRRDDTGSINETMRQHDNLFDQDQSKGAWHTGKFCDIAVEIVLGNETLAQELFGQFWVGDGAGVEISTT